MKNVKIVGNFFTSGVTCSFHERICAVDLKVGLKAIVVAADVGREGLMTELHFRV
jgi:hypothetical protein